MDDINTAFLAMAHIVIKNPIVHDDLNTRDEYIKRLNAYIKAGGWNRRKLESAEVSSYERIILGNDEVTVRHGISYYKYFILLDIYHILGYELNATDIEKLESVKVKYFADFSQDTVDVKLVDTIIKAFSKDSKRFKRLRYNSKLVQEKEYIQLIIRNNRFRKKEPAAVMVTATMSAGKSTFINALIGKYICLSQNMACTSKIHCIVNKAFEDDFAYEYDHDLVLTAGREELLKDNELNASDKIVVSTKFDGYLKNERIIVNDSPGVNYSGDQDHKKITDQLIKRKNYDLLVYIMNATQLGTNDESEHLDFVKRSIGRTPVIFAINKMDTFNVEEEDIGAAIKRQIEFLKEKGFKDPIVCPVSSRAGYLAKQFISGKLSRTEERELYNYVDKFDQMKLPKYYAKTFKKIVVADSEQEEKQLLKTSGLAYIEKIITALTTGGKANGADLR